MQTCTKHNIELECLAGHSAHQDNWYCPECDREAEEAKANDAAASPNERVVSRHGVGDYCHPGDDQRQRWILMFEDSDVPNSIYYEKTEAWRAFERAELRGWNCHLLTSVPRVIAC